MNRRQFMSGIGLIAISPAALAELIKAPVVEVPEWRWCHTPRRWRYTTKEYDEAIKAIMEAKKPNVPAWYYSGHPDPFSRDPEYKRFVERMLEQAKAEKAELLHIVQEGEPSVMQRDDLRRSDPNFTCTIV